MTFTVSAGAIRTGHLQRRDIRTIRRMASESGRLAAIHWTRRALQAIANPRAAAEGNFAVARSIVDLWTD